MTVRYKDQKKQVEVHVIQGQGPCFFGRDLFQHFTLDWAKIIQIKVGGTSSKEVEQLLGKYDDVFSKEVGVMKYH